MALKSRSSRDIHPLLHLRQTSPPTKLVTDIGPRVLTRRPSRRNGWATISLRGLSVRQLATRGKCALLPGARTSSSTSSRMAASQRHGPRGGFLSAPTVDRSCEKGFFPLLQLYGSRGPPSQCLIQSKLGIVDHDRNRVRVACGYELDKHSRFEGRRSSLSRFR